MSEIEVRESPTTNAGHAPTRLWSRQSGLNDNAAWLLIVVTALVPLPLGSNRPFFWGVTALLVGLAGLYYVLRLRLLCEPLRYGIGRLWPSALLAASLAIYAGVQAAPIVPWIEQFLPASTLAIPTAAGVGIASPTISVAPGATLLALLRLGTYGMFFLLVLQVGTSRQRKYFILHCALAIVTVYAIAGIVSLVQLNDTILGFPKWAYEGFATGTFVNRNSFATFLAFGAVVATSLLTAGIVRVGEDRQVRRRSLDLLPLLYAVCLTAISAALLATQSRMGAFAALSGCILVAAINIVASPNRLLGALALIGTVVVGAAAGIYLYGTGLLERLGSVEQSADVRMELYQQIVAMISARPWLGYGGGTFELAYPLFHQLPVSPDLVWDRAHSTYLALWSEYGLVAGSIPMVLIVFAVAKIVWGMRRERSDWVARVAALGIVTVAAIHSLVDFSLEIQGNAILFLLLLATGMSGVTRGTPGK